MLSRARKKKKRGGAASLMFCFNTTWKSSLNKSLNSAKKRENILYVFFFVVVIITLNINAGSTLDNFILIVNVTHTQKKTKLQNTNTRVSGAVHLLWGIFLNVRMCLCLQEWETEEGGEEEGGEKSSRVNSLIRDAQVCPSHLECMSESLEKKKKSGVYCAGAALKASRRRRRLHMPSVHAGTTVWLETVTQTRSVPSQIIEKLGNGCLGGGGHFMLSWSSSGKRREKNKSSQS